MTEMALFLLLAVILLVCGVNYLQRLSCELISRLIDGIGFW